MAQIYISLGSNVDREKHTRAGLQALHQSFGALQLSSLFESEAVGFDGKPFYNMVIGATTTKTMPEVAHLLKQIEADNGRVRGGKKFSPRTLDLDLLLYDDLVTDELVQLPRGEIQCFFTLSAGRNSSRTATPVGATILCAVMAGF